MVLDVGPSGSADSVYARSPFVLRDTDGTYKMWYSGYDGLRNRGMYATSADGIHWTKQGVIMDVLTAPYNWDSVGSMHVIKVGTTYEGWFSAGYWTGGAFGYWAQIYHATSANGTTWNVTGVALAPNQAWDLGMTNNPSVVRDASGVYWMSFSGWDGTTTRLGIATSVNGTVFVPYAGNPILPLGSTGAWDSVDTTVSSLLGSGSAWTIWYDGWDGSTNRIGVARSSDGFHWTKDANNPVFTPEPSPAWDDQNALGPDVLVLPGGPVLYYVGGDGTYQRIGLDPLPPLARTMVLDVGASGSADSLGAYMPFVLHDSDGTYKMWYTGNSGNHVSVLLATSPDGLAWTKVGVVMDVSNGADSPFVMKIGSTYHMWFTVGTWCCSTIGYLDQIYHTTSTDGAHWTAPVFAVGVGPAGSWNNDTVSEPWIVQDAAGLYRMFYGGWNDVPLVQIGEATSTDLVNWTPYSGNPVLSFGAAGTWDSAAVVTPSVMRNGNAWTLYYAGHANGTPSVIGRALSSDGYHWTKDAANPILGPEPSPAWDDVGIGSPDLIELPIGPALYYSGDNGTNTRIGLLSFDAALPAPPPSSTPSPASVPLVNYVSPRGYICPVPAGWSRTYNLTSGQFSYELFLAGTIGGFPANMLVDSENASGVQETSAYLNGLVSNVVSGLQGGLPDAYLQSSNILTVSNHSGVTFVIGYTAHPVVQYGLIAVSAANSREWNVILTGSSSAVGTINATFAQIVSGFTITLSSTPPSSPGPRPGVSVSAWYLGAVFAVIIAAIVVVAFLASRGPRPMSPAGPTGPMTFAAPPPALLSCPYCGASLEPGARFCGSCGTPMMSGPPPPPPPGYP